MSCIGTVLVCPRCGTEHKKRYVPVDFLNEARMQRDQLQAAVDRAYDNVQEFADDPDVALRCVAERLEPLVTPQSSEQSANKPASTATNQNQRDAER